MTVEIAFILAILIAAVHLIGEKLEEHITGYREQVVSFSSGVSITYIFVQLMPEFHRIALDSTELIFAFPLLGFSSVHLIEKYIAKSGVEGEAMREEFGEVHSVFLFLYHGAIGYLIASLLAADTVSGLLFFMPIIMHVAVSSFSVTELHENFRRKSSKYAIGLAPIIGVAAHNLEIIASQHFNPIFGTVIGMFFYIVIRDSIPRDDKGRPLEYVAGTVLYLAVILIANTL